ncbi:hypothetical protein CEXT_607321, partial [Caerostris extrusa]
MDFEPATDIHKHIAARAQRSEKRHGARRKLSASPAWAHSGHTIYMNYSANVAAM